MTWKHGVRVLTTPAVGVSCSLKWTESFLPPPTSVSISTTWSDDGMDIVSTADNVPCASTADTKAATCPLGDFIGHTTKNLTAVFHAPSSALAGKSATLQVSCADVANCNVRNDVLLRSIQCTYLFFILNKGDYRQKNDIVAATTYDQCASESRHRGSRLQSLAIG